MEATNMNSDAVAAGDLRIAKRTASEELEDASVTQRTENSEVPPTIPYDRGPKPTVKVCFLEKVCQNHTNKNIY